MKGNKRIFAAIFGLGCMLTAWAADKDVPLIQNVLGYESQSLNGAWNYIVDVQEEGYYDYRMNPTRWGFFQNAKPQKPEDLIEYDFDKSPTMQIPSDWNTQDEKLFFYEGTVWFYKQFNVQCSTPKGSRANCENEVAMFNVQSKKLQLWSPENPKLYQVKISVGANTVSDEIGFRTIETRDKQILLNGKPIFLKGISIHNEKPNGGGRANSVEDARTLLSWAKELGCNFVRLAHYPHHEEMVREAEKMGILVWSEIPVYWTIAWKNPQTYENAKNQLTDMIARDHNRANIIIWSIANETPHSPERDTFLGNLAQYARTLDNTRLISMAMEVTGASNYVNQLNDNMNKYVDVVSFNQYIGWYRDVNDAPKMKWEIPYNKPVIISEFGGGARYGLHGPKNQRWTEEFQENLYIENCAMLDKIEGLAGTTPWILKDFRSPRRVLPGVQDYYNRKGLFSDKGEKKKAFYVLKKWYEGK